MLNWGCVLVFVSLLCISTLVQSQSYTTPYIEQVFKGKCLYKTTITQSDVVKAFSSSESYCNELWKRFSDTASLPSYQQTADTWAPFFEIADFTSPRNGAMLWSGSFTLSQALAYRYTTLEATVTGYILNGLWWCPGDLVDSPFNLTTACAYYENVPSGYYGLAPVWREASKRFASGISGEVVVLLQSRFDYSNPNAVPATFRNDSIFVSVELPTLQPDVVTGVVVLYMPGDRKYFETENCNAGTLVGLRNAVTTRFSGSNTKYYCFDDGKLLQRLCTDKTTEAIQSQTAEDTHTELVAFTDKFDYGSSFAKPECAVGVLSYLAGVDGGESSRENVSGATLLVLPQVLLCVLMILFVLV